MFGFALGEKILAAIFVFLDPFFREAAVANLRQEFFHFIASLLGHDARACGVVTVLRGIADGVAHVAEAAAIDEIYDKFEFVEAFEIGDFRLIARFGERFETRFDQSADTAAEDGLFAEKIRFGFFGESGFENTGTSELRILCCCSPPYADADTFFE